MESLKSTGLLVCVVLLGAAPHLVAANPAFLPPPVIPADNPTTPEKVTLGQRLFADTALSINGTYSCASCHQPDRHFTDGRALAVGATGDTLATSTPTLYNVAYNSSLGWRNDGVTTLEQHHTQPLLKHSPLEMGFSETLLPALKPAYGEQFERVFGTSQITVERIIAAIASYVRTIHPPRTPFDELMFFDDHDALSEQARTGMSLFFSPRLGCANCHGSINLSGPISHTATATPPAFHITGVDGSTVPFRAPTLRAIAHTAPYMHAGTLPTLEAVLIHYQSVDVENVPDFTLSDEESRALIAFLQSL